MNLKNILPVAGATLALAALAGGAQAQTDLTNATLVFQDDGGRATLGTSTTVAALGRGLGYDTQNTFGAFQDGTSAPNFQSFYNNFQVGSTVSAGSTLQFAIHGDANNNNAGDGAAPIPVTLSLYAFQDKGAGTLPLGMLIGTTTDSFKSTTAIADILNFSADFTVNTALTTGTTYILGLSTPSTLAFVDAVTRRSGKGNPSPLLSPLNVGTFGNNIYETVGGSSTLSPTYSNVGNPADPTGQNVKNDPLGFRIYAQAAPPAVPEASSVISFAALLGLGGLFLVRRRRAN